jgi:hypothetical protein
MGNHAGGIFGTLRTIEQGFNGYYGRFVAICACALRRGAPAHEKRGKPVRSQPCRVAIPIRKIKTRRFAPTGQVPGVDCWDRTHQRCW